MTSDLSTILPLDIDGSRVSVLVCFEVVEGRPSVISVSRIDTESELNFPELPLDQREDILEACKKEILNQNPQ